MRTGAMQYVTMGRDDYANSFIAWDGLKGSCCRLDAMPGRRWSSSPAITMSLTFVGNFVKHTKT